MKRLAQLLALGLLSLASRSRADAPVVLFDQGHGQRFVVERAGTLDLSGLASLFADQGLQVRVTRERLTREQLAGASVLVISGPFAPLTPAEVEAVSRFVRNGGRLCVMLHIAPSFEGFLASLGVSASKGVVNEQENRIDGKPLDFRVTRLSRHPVTEGLAGFNVYGAWAVAPAAEGVQVVAETGPGAWVDLDRDRRRSEAEPAQSLGIAVAGELGQGRFVVFGDDAVFQNQFLQEDNRALGKSLVRWLSSVGL